MTEADTKYVVNDDGYVVVKYRFGKPLVAILPFFALLLIGLPIFLCLLYELMVDAIFDVAIFISGAFSLISAIGLLGTSKKTKRAYLELLSKNM